MLLILGPFDCDDIFGRHSCFWGCFWCCLPPIGRNDPPCLENPLPYFHPHTKANPLVVTLHSRGFEGLPEFIDAFLREITTSN